MADNVTYRFIHNEGDYFPSGYFTEDFITKVQTCAGVSADEMKNIRAPYIELRREYDEYKKFIVDSHSRTTDAIRATHAWHTKLLKVLGYPFEHPYDEPYLAGEGADANGVTEIIPVRHILRTGQKISLLVMEMQHLVSVNDIPRPGLFEQQYEDGKDTPQRYWAGQWKGVIPEKYLDKTKYRFSPAIINKAITQLFLANDERRPHYILMLAGNCVFLFDQEKWSRGSYLQFSLDDLFSQGQVNATRLYYSLFHLLVRKETLSSDGQTILMDSLIEESYKSAYEVTKDLKEGVVTAVETIANEALYYMKNVVHQPFGKRVEGANGEITYDETDDEFENEVKDDCINIVYRLLFILFAESRPELNILPTDDEVYKHGYSFESLRDLEQVNLISQASRNGYFFDDSIKCLFRILSDGYQPFVGAQEVNKSFFAKRIDSPLFSEQALKHLKDVRLRNIHWQKIICALSLSHAGRFAGRISYANLGINQIGSVYESLLAYRGFYAEEDYIEVHKENNPSDGTFLVPYSRCDDFKIGEILRDETGEVKRLKKGQFVYRLNGRDRQKSASYYTPEVLTKSTVKYTLKAFIDEVKAGKRKASDLLEFKILEPAMGAAAFQNEVINQIAEAYLTCQQQQKREKGETNWRIDPDRFRDELQKVKAYIATHNVYGVDLNPTAVELGKLSLWLNVIHKDMETPFFAGHLALGNAVIGAWLKVYDKEDFLGIKSRNGKKLEKNEWWKKAPHKVKFRKNSVGRLANEVYHFLLPDENMLAVRSIKEQKRQHPEAAQRMAALIKDWTAPITEKDFRRLQYLSGKIDVLLKDHLQFQLSIDALTMSKANLWGIPGRSELNLNRYNEKQRLHETRYNHDAAYFRLKMVMDYWCALWFWNYEHADDLPTRAEFWDDIEKILAVPDDRLDKLTLAAKEQMNLIYDEFIYGDIFATAAKQEAEDGGADIAILSKDQILASGNHTGYFDRSPRLQLVKSFADRYRFFHPMLDFLEVFWQRGGFDIICGNPPWLNVAFDDKAVISERFPEVVTRKVSAPDVRKMKDDLFKNTSMRRIYESEEIEIECSKEFLNAFSNYPLLIGHRANLYKAVLSSCFELINTNGFAGLLTPEGIYDDPKGQTLRRELYKRLRYHFQYENELNLFAGTNDHGRMRFGEHIFGGTQNDVSFDTMCNIFHPLTIDASYAHDGHGICGGIKDENNRWNINGHKNRIVHITREELKICAKAFEASDDWEGAKLTSIHDANILGIIQKFAYYQTHVSDSKPRIDVCFNETIAVDDGIIKRETYFPEAESYEMVYNGPQFYVGNAFYKTPKEKCNSNNDYENIDLTQAGDKINLRTNYRLCKPLNEYRQIIKGFIVGQNDEGHPLYDNWIDYYKVSFRSMLNQTGERTLICAVLLRKTAHINAVVSVAFRDGNNCVDMCSLCMSLPLDFYLKIIGISNLGREMLESFPMGVDEKYNAALRSRTLRLNCLTKGYDDLWRECWSDAYTRETWSLEDARLAPWSELTPTWQHTSPLRNYFERRMALVEIDVIAAMALGLSLADLEMMYRIQFPVLQQNENDTWYDAKGNIVFTCSKGLTGVGLSRPQWEAMRGEPSADGMSYAGLDATYVHTIDPAKSELYGGCEVTYTAPYTRCDRIADYRRAWSHFERRMA